MDNLGVRTWEPLNENNYTENNQVGCSHSFDGIWKHPSTIQVTEGFWGHQNRINRLSVPSRAVKLLTALLWHQHPLQLAFVHKCPADTRMSWCKIASGHKWSRSQPSSNHATCWMARYPHHCDKTFTCWTCWSTSIGFPGTKIPIFPGVTCHPPLSQKGWTLCIQEHARSCLADGHGLLTAENRQLEAKRLKILTIKRHSLNTIYGVDFSIPFTIHSKKASWVRQDIFESSNWALMHWSPIARRTRSSFSCYIKSVVLDHSGALKFIGCLKMTFTWFFGIRDALIWIWLQPFALHGCILFKFNINLTSSYPMWRVVGLFKCLLYHFLRSSSHPYPTHFERLFLVGFFEDWWLVIRGAPVGLPEHLWRVSSADPGKVAKGTRVLYQNVCWKKYNNN